MTLWKNLVVALVAAFALAACSSSDDAATVMPDPEPTPQMVCEDADGRWNANETCTSAGDLAYEMALKAIAEATTADAAQAAYDEVKDDVTAAQGDALQMAVDAQIAALAMMDRADMQKMALMNAADMIDTSDLSTQEAVDTANTAIAALEAALAAATDVSDADKAMYQGQVTAAETVVANAQSALDHAAQTMALSGAVDALGAIDLSDLSDEAKIDAAEAAIAAIQAALDAATELSAAEKAVAMTLVATANRTVMAAQGRMDVAGQTMALAEAVAALGAIDLDDLMTQAQIDAANAAIIALDLALAEASDLTDAEKLDATVDVTLAKRKVTAAETVLAANIGDQRMALSEAGTDLDAIDLTDLDTAEKIAAANEAVDALKMALANATHLSDAAKAMYQTQLDTATETVRVAQTGMDRDGRMMAQGTAITNAVTMARTAVAGVSDTSTDSEVAAADAAVKAVKDAIAAAEDLSEDAAEIIIANAVLETIEPLLAAAKTSRTAAMAKAEEERGKSNAALGKAMHAALEGPLSSVGPNALKNATVALATDLTITAADGAGAIADGTVPPAATLKAGASAGALGSWNGMDYAISTGTGDAKVTDEARVYTNKGPGKSVPFAEAGYTIIPADDATNASSVLLVTNGDAEGEIELTDVMATAFEHQGTRTHPIPSNNLALKVRGTFDGAPGEFSCTGTCTSTNDGSGAPSRLGGTWHFKPDTGAMVNQPDAEYLYYGWWVSKDSKGMPTAASAFAGVVEASANDLDRAWTDAWTPDTPQITGSATYAGNAVGKFAMNNPLDSTGNGGHFTADAELNAKFTGDDAGVTGTIDNFRLNDGTDDPGWSVELGLATLGSDGAFASSVDDQDTGIVNEATMPVWSINGNEAAAAGTWGGTMYDEMPGAAPDGDGSNIPTTVTGTFYSEFSTIGRMVGAFGANKQ